MEFALSAITAIVIEAARCAIPNLTVTRSSAPASSALVVAPVVDGDGIPTWSNLNYQVDEDRANLAIIRPIRTRIVRIFVGRN